MLHLPGEVQPGLWETDLDKDGSPEISLLLWEAYIAMARGPRRLWEHTGDGRLEVVVACLDGLLLVLDLMSGTEVLRLQRSAAIPSAPGLGDLDGDGLIDVVVADQAGKLCAISGHLVRAARARDED